MCPPEALGLFFKEFDSTLGLSKCYARLEKCIMPFATSPILV